MAGQLIPLEEAAKLLKISPAELNDMRSRSEIFGVRTGSTWKFKMEEIERVADERGISLAGGDVGGDLAFDDDEVIDAGSSLDFDALEDDASTEGASSILVSEVELGKSDTPSSTIIGDEDRGGDSDLVLAASGDKEGGAKGDSPSDLRLAPSPAESGELSLAAESDLSLAPAPQAQAKAPAAESDLTLASDSGVEPTDSDLEKIGGSDLELSGDSDLDLGAEVLAGAGESDLLLAGADDLGPGDTGKLDKKVKTSDLEFAGDDLDLEVSASSSALDLGGDDELVLDSESALDGDIALAGDSGINLARPSDSGIDLAGADGSGISLSSVAGESGFMLEDEDAMELEGGSSVDSLELPDDVDIVSLDEELADPDAATQLKSADDFDLTPVEGAIDDESDSGSQVIALDTEELDADASTQLGGMAIASAPSSMSVAEALITEEPADAFAGVPTTHEPAAYATPGQQTQFPQELPEAPYSIWQVLSLTVVALLLAFTGILMMDVVRNIWSFDQPYAASTSIMNSIIEALGI